MSDLHAEPPSAALPPGQILTGRFPVVGEAQPAPGVPNVLDPHTEDVDRHWSVNIHGLVERPVTLSLQQLLQRPAQSRRIDIHCVTGWSRLNVEIVGVPLAEVLAEAGLQSAARHVRFVAHSTRAHDTSLPLPLALAETWLVHRMDGAALSVEHGGPLRTVTPGRYFYKSLKWLAAIEVLGEDQLGYWERASAYHNGADPWREERFDESQMASATEVAAFRAASDLREFRGRLWLKARLGGWQPASRELTELVCKSCSFRNAVLSDCDFSGGNFSLSSFEGADLQRTQWRDCDLEGVSFAGADLRGAVMDRPALSATRFYRDFANGRRLSAQVEGLKIREGTGLVESQRAFLSDAGAQLEQC